MPQGAAGQAFTEGSPPAVVPAGPPGGPLRHRLTGGADLVEKEVLTGLGIVAVRVEQGVGWVCLGELGSGDRLVEPPDAPHRSDEIGRGRGA